MNRKTIATLLITAGAALSFPAMAQMGPMGGAPMADPYGDGTVTKAEADAQAGTRFDQLDTNHDGVLSTEEMAAGRPARPAGAAPAGGPQGAPPAGAAAGAPAGPAGQGGGMMRQMDANNDGKITKDEYVAAQGRRFAQMDENKDGKLTKQERNDFFEDMRARMMMRGQGN
jgi:hypothetical protein